MRNSFILFTCFLRFRDETGYKAVGDGGTYPDFGQQVFGVFVAGLQVDVDVIEGGDDHVDDADGPQVALGVALPVLAGVEEGEHAEQQHRQREAGQMQGVVG